MTNDTRIKILAAAIHRALQIQYGATMTEDFHGSIDIQPKIQKGRLECLVLAGRRFNVSDLIPDKSLTINSESA